MDKMTLQDFIRDMGDGRAAALFGVKERTAASWRRGERFPRAQDIPRMIELSGGRLEYASFFHGRDAA